MDEAERLRRSRLARWGTRTVEERFWQKVDKSGNCWLWTGATRNGYGHFAMDGGPQYAHRLSWKMAHPNETIPEGIEICHSCDVKACVKPAHLWVGTRAQNAADMAAKGRSGGWRLKKLPHERYRSPTTYVRKPWHLNPRYLGTGPPRGEEWHRIHKPKTECKYGHPFPENRDPKVGGCILCRARRNREHSRRVWARKRAAV